MLRLPEPLLLGRVLVVEDAIRPVEACPSVALLEAQLTRLRAMDHMVFGG